MSDRFVVPRAADLAPSPTMAVAKEAQRLRREGVDVVDFGPGEPDFDTPAHIVAAAKEALDRGMTHYPPSAGIPELRQAVARKLERENGISYDPMTEILITPGAKPAIVETVLTTVAPGDEVLVIEPTWGSYAAIVTLAEGRAVPVQSAPDLTLDADALRAAVTPRTRAVLVASPSNPTGFVYRRAEWEEIAAVCIEHDLLLISDEIYERITYGDAAPISPASLPGMWERTVTINGFSKAYAMTGWRLGYVAAPAPLLAQILKVHEQVVTGVTAFGQAGAVAALEGPQEPLHAMVREFARRREIVVEGLCSLPGFRCTSPDGAFYAFPEITGTGMSGTELARLLLRHGVAVTPGIGFGDQWDTRIRLSYATSEERIRTGLERMRAALEEARA